MGQKSPLPLKAVNLTSQSRERHVNRLHKFPPDIKGLQELAIQKELVTVDHSLKRHTFFRLRETAVEAASTSSFAWLLGPQSKRLTLASGGGRGSMYCRQAVGIQGILGVAERLCNKDSHQLQSVQNESKNAIRKTVNGFIKI